MASEIRTITISCGASASARTSVSFEKDLSIEKIMITERGGAALHNVHLTIDVDGVFLIRPSMPCSQVGTNYFNALPLEFVVKKGSTLTIAITNNLTTAITLDCALIVK